MKKTNLFTRIAILLITISSYKSIASNLLIISNSSTAISKQTQTVEAYVLWGGNWRKGQITYMSTKEGYKPISYNFQDVDPRLRGNYYSERFTPLNPNNELAKANNWTHSIGIQGATAYLTLY